MSQETALSQQTALSEQKIPSGVPAQTKIAQLIWLGAGSASQPAGIIKQADKVLLIEARPAACQQLSKQFSQQPQVEVKQAIVSEQGGEVHFTEYNLAEFSAINTATGLTELFPGLKALATEKLHSESIVAVLKSVALTGNNNLLLIDIADLSLALLKQLHAANLLQHFSQLWLQGSGIALYQGAATTPELISWLQQHGYMVDAKDNADPDLPWVQFQLNPLWPELQQSQLQLKQLSEQKQQTEQAKVDLVKQIDATNQQLATEQKKAEQAKAELLKQLEVAKQQASSDKQQAGHANAELAKQLEATTQQARTDLQQAKENSRNVLAKLEQAEINNTKILAELEEQKLQYQQKHAEISKQLTNTISEKETLQQQLAAARVAAEKTQAELNDRITGMDAELETALEQRKNTEQHHASVNEQLKQQTLAAEQQKVELNRQLDNLTKQLQQQAEQHKREAQTAEHKQAQDITRLQSELEQVQKHAANRLDKIAELEKTNRLLNETNTQLNKRQHALEHEMLKAQAQIDIIKDLLLKQ